MRIRILSRIKNNYSNYRLVYEGRKRGCLVSLVDPLDYTIVLNRKTPLLYRNDKRVKKADVVIPRLGASATSYALAVVNQFETMGMKVLNRALPTFRSMDKLRCLQFLSRKDIDIPKTVVIRRPTDIEAAVERIGGFPVVLKLLSGTQGIGVMLAENYRTIESTLDTLWSLGQDILLQECIKESFGRDIRAFVVAGKVVAVMRREARIGEFRSNLHRGGKGTGIEISPQVEKVALQATRVVGLDIAGVDMLESKRGPKVVEVNSSPGLEGIEKSTGVNVAGKIIDFAVEFAGKKRGERRNGLRLMSA